MSPFTRVEVQKRQMYRDRKQTNSYQRLGDGENKGRVLGQYKRVRSSFLKLWKWSKINCGAGCTMQRRCWRSLHCPFNGWSEQWRHYVSAVNTTLHTSNYKINPEHLFIPQSEKTIKDFWGHIKMNSANNLRSCHCSKMGRNITTGPMCNGLDTVCLYTCIQNVPEKSQSTGHVRGS